MARAATATLVAVLVAAASACGDNQGDGDPELTPAATVGEPLVDNDAWTVVPDTADPFLAHRPDAFHCDETGYAAEDLGGARTLGIETGDCNYLSVVQPSLEAVEAGDSLRLRIYHFELAAPGPAAAYLAVAFDGSPVWEQSVPIPADAGLNEATWVAAEAVPAGTPVMFHLDNHGTNSWALIEIAKLVPGTQPTQ